MAPSCAVAAARVRLGGALLSPCEVDLTRNATGALGCGFEPIVAEPSLCALTVLHVELHKHRLWISAVAIYRTVGDPIFQA